MILPVYNFKITNTTQPFENPSFKKGFVRTEGLFNAGGVSIWESKTQKMILKSLSPQKLDKLMQLLEETTNERILFCDIRRGGLFKRNLTAHFGCTYFLNNFTENFKQKPLLESRWNFLMRMLNQFEKYRTQLTERGIKV